ncbi:sensor histidine kinase [Microbacterium sp. Clip185]|uniref:sensor histidine kinase n=1 Tax=Microbacterium sp. Clip185 TaxID=3025663 RepID=UPI002366183B|nr:sensor histidine kinase [Microbacterium sp. Clip185]WDG17124.1 sensor histidine kinase [Microbacterium sp. Clip185]
MRFATRMLLAQIVTQVTVVGVCTSVFLLLGVNQLRSGAESSALNIARTVAEDPEVRTLVADYSADPGTPDAAGLIDGPLQRYAHAVTARTEGLFVVITDDHGIRLAHPDPARLGETVSTSYADALAGREVVTWERGTLGDSARAKVPVYAPDDDRPIGEVSVGFEPASVFDDLPSLLGGIGAAVILAGGIGAVVAVGMRRRLETVTLGAQPEELAALVRTQTAVLDSADDGIVAVDPDGVVRVCTPAASRLLHLDEPALGRTLDELGMEAELAAALRTPGRRDELLVGDRVLYLDVRPVRRGAYALGTAAVLRDRTDLVALSQRLGSVRSMSDALRVQRHEFANRLHAAGALLEAGRVDEARDFVWSLLDRGAIDYAVPGLPAVTDPLLQSFLGAKGISAAERGVALSVAEESLVWRETTDVEDVASVLGNLVDNAIDAAASGTEPRRVEVTVLQDGDALVATVADSGGGVSDPGALFRPRPPDPAAPAERVRGLGIGLPLARELARRRGGDVWLIDAGGSASGAVFGARLPGVFPVSPDHEQEDP